MRAMAGEKSVERMAFLHRGLPWISKAETQWANVVYRRRNGGYGLIEPEV
jgi:hypothetical protein